MCATYIPGRYDPELGYFSYDISVYYDDIDHTNTIHHAFYLRFFEHAREHMLGQDFLPTLLDTENVIIVAVNSEQTHHDFNFPRIGNVLNIRTRVSLDSQYRIKFLHEAWKEGVILVKGHVEMVCLNASTLQLVPLPCVMTTALHGETASPLPKLSIRRKQLVQDVNYQYNGSVSDYDTDFTW